MTALIDGTIVIELAEQGIPGTPGKFRRGTPASPTAAGVAGSALYDDNYIYICTATNTWRGTAINTFPWTPRERIIISDDPNDTEVTKADGDLIVIFNSDSDQPKSITIPDSTGDGQKITGIDQFGDSENNPISIFTKSGALVAVISTNRNSMDFYDSGAGWCIL